MSTRTPAQAIAWANDQKDGFDGECLAFVRTAYDIPAHEPDAAAAWKNAKHKHAGASLAAAPVGAFVHMKGANPHGHVCLYLGGGKVRTSDDVVGHPATYTLDQMASFGYRVLGWSEDVNGVRVAGLKPKTTSKPAKPASGTLAKGSKGSAVGKLQAGLKRVFPAYAGSLAVDDVFGDKTDAAVREFQRRAGLVVDGIVGPKTTAALARFGIEL